MQVSGDMRLLKGVRLPWFNPKVPGKRIPMIPTRSWKNTCGHWLLIGCVSARTLIQLVINSVIPTKVDIFLPHYVDRYFYYKRMDSDLQCPAKK
jgi:hypothetical protein